MVEVCKVLVTGGSGLVGLAIKDIKDEFPEYEFVFVSSSDVNLLDYDVTLEYFRLVNPSAIIHLAANVGGLYKNIQYPVQMLELNLLINSNVLSAAHELKVPRLIGCLSTCIFPDATSYPIDETMLHLGPPHPSNAAYAYAKRILGVHIDAYVTQYGYNWNCVIPTNIYGPNDNFNLEESHVIPGLIHKCWISKNSHIPFVISGSGSPLRQFVHSYDLARGIIQILKLSNPGPIIISPDPSDEVSIGLIGKLIAKEFEIDPEQIQFDTTKSDGQYKKTASNSKFRSYFPDFKFVQVDVGIPQTIRWFKSKYPDIRK
jgi:GDP-L-fucose synthase